MQKKPAKIVMGRARRTTTRGASYSTITKPPDDLAVREDSGELEALFEQWRRENELNPPSKEELRQFDEIMKRLERRCGPGCWCKTLTKEDRLAMTATVRQRQSRRRAAPERETPISKQVGPPVPPLDDATRERYRRAASLIEKWMTEPGDFTEQELADFERQMAADRYGTSEVRKKR